MTSPLALLVLAVVSKPFSRYTSVLVALEALGLCTLLSAASSSSYWYIWSRNACAVPLGIPHSTQQDAQLCGYTIPCETVVICNHQAVHLNETSWNNPCEFDPERFLDEDCEQPRLLRCISNFLPFGLGTNKDVFDYRIRIRIHTESRFGFSENVHSNNESEFGFRFGETCLPLVYQSHSICQVNLKRDSV